MGEQWESIARALREHCESIGRALGKHWESIGRAFGESIRGEHSGKSWVVGHRKHAGGSFGSIWARAKSRKPQSQSCQSHRTKIVPKNKNRRSPYELSSQAHRTTLRQRLQTLQLSPALPDTLTLAPCSWAPGPKPACDSWQPCTGLSRLLKGPTRPATGKAAEHATVLPQSQQCPVKDGTSASGMQFQDLSTDCSAFLNQEDWASTKHRRTSGSLWQHLTFGFNVCSSQVK